ASTQAQIPTVIGGGRALELYDPDKGLQEIAVAEASERHWERAKDATNLFKAIETKLTAQAEYVVWRDSVVVHGGDRKSKFQIRNLDPPPKADPGAVVIHRWRKRLCTETEPTAIDQEKMQVALAEVGNRCQTCRAGASREFQFRVE